MFLLSDRKESGAAVTNEELLEQQKELSDTLKKQVKQLAKVQLSASWRTAMLKNELVLADDEMGCRTSGTQV